MGEVLGSLAMTPDTRAKLKAAAEAECRSEVRDNEYWCRHCGDDWSRHSSSCPVGWTLALLADVERLEGERNAALEKRYEGYELAWRDRQHNIDPTGGPETCPTWYDGCNCTMETLDHVLVLNRQAADQLSTLQARVGALEAALRALVDACVVTSAPVTECRVCRAAWGMSYPANHEPECPILAASAAL